MCKVALGPLKTESEFHVWDYKISFNYFLYSCGKGLVNRIFNINTQNKEIYVHLEQWAELSLDFYGVLNNYPHYRWNFNPKIIILF